MTFIDFAICTFYSRNRIEQKSEKQSFYCVILQPKFLIVCWF